MFSLSSLFLVLAAAAPAFSQLSFGADGTPLLKVASGTYPATEYDKTNDFYTFGNIRFGAPAVGNLRWAKPQAPAAAQGLQNNTQVQCPQAIPRFIAEMFPADMGDPIDMVTGTEAVSEDCLFLDVRVPAKALRGEVKSLPVMVWFYGGGYVLGSKGFSFYNPTPLMKAAQGGMIQVSPNYRLGAFGFLTGEAVANSGTYNVGFWDQRAALQWVQDNIGFVGGDKNAVTVMGESAGGGSILHHVVAGGGQGEFKPLFQRAIVQSPAYAPRANTASFEEDFKVFSAYAGCPAAKDLSCLRSKPTETLIKANLDAVMNSPGGGFNFGPVVDGTLFADVPSKLFDAGKYWKDINVLAAHNTNEGLMFAPSNITTNEQYDAYMDLNFAGMSTADRQKMDQLYPPPWTLGSPYFSQQARLAANGGDRTFNCNVRYLAKAYPGKAWAYRFDVSPAIHGMDLFFTFYQPLTLGLDLSALGINVDLLGAQAFTDAYQSYLISFIRTGNPNTYRKTTGTPATVEVPNAKVGSMVGGVVNIALDKFQIIDDNNLAQAQCDFWGNLDYKSLTGKPI